MRQYSGDHRPSAVEQTNAAIIRYLQDEGLKDGDRLPNERDLSVQLGVGRSTLRENPEIKSIPTADGGVDSARGIPSLITDIREQVFTEVARLAYSGNGYEGIDELPYKIVPGGCVAGPGTILPVEKAVKFVEKYSKEAIAASPDDSPYKNVGSSLD